MSVAELETPRVCTKQGFEVGHVLVLWTLTLVSWQPESLLPGCPEVGGMLSVARVRESWRRGEDGWDRPSRVLLKRKVVKLGLRRKLTKETGAGNGSWELVKGGPLGLAVEGWNW